MSSERNYTAERIAHIEALLTEIKRRIADLAPADRATARELRARLDAILEELQGRVQPSPTTRKD